MRQGLAIRHVIDPGRYRCEWLACELADKWLEIAGELGAVADTVATSVRAFLRFADTAWPAPGDLTLAGGRRGAPDARGAGLPRPRRGGRRGAPLPPGGGLLRPVAPGRGDAPRR